MEHNKSNVLKWSLIIGIVIVLNLFFNYALSVVYSAPEYDAFCKQEQVIEPISTRAACLAIGGQWNENSSPELKNYFCDPTFTCRQDFEATSKIYDRNVFVTLVVLGVATLALSFFFTGNLVIAYGLSLGGVLSFVIASMRYWGSADDFIKLIILALALAALIYLAAKKFSNRV